MLLAALLVQLPATVMGAPNVLVLTAEIVRLLKIVTVLISWAPPLKVMVLVDGVKVVTPQFPVNVTPPVPLQVMVLILTFPFTVAIPVERVTVPVPVNEVQVRLFA